MDLFEQTDEPAKLGFRLQRLEIYNWGTFDQKVWSLELKGDTSLLTGDVGSGKSTLVDAIITLLVPPKKVTYNKAADASAKERSLASYVRGYFAQKRTEDGGGKPEALRDRNQYSVILGVFGDENLGGVALLNNTQYAYTYVAKTNQYGVINWVQTTSSSDGGIFGRSVCADNSGNLYITGEFIKNGVVGSVSLSSATKDAFWAKIDSQGNWKWAKQSQTGSVIAENFCAGKSISVDAEGNPFLSGNFMGNTVLGNTTHQTNNFENGFWAKLNTDGSISWLKKTNSTGTANVNDLIPDNQGYLYLTGYYGNKAAFDSIQPTWRGSTDIFVLKSKQ